MGKIYNAMKCHMIDTTAFLMVCHPVMAAFEVNVADMSNETSMSARLLSTAFNYGGLGSVYSKGRDLSKRIFKITKDTNERMKEIHDTIYCIAFNTLVQPPFYYLAGSRNAREIAIGTTVTAAVSLLTGSAIGYAIDTYRDLTGLQESERLPSFLKLQTPKTKKYVAGLLTTVSVGALAVIYSLSK